jgi:hypothetical protein
VRGLHDRVISAQLADGTHRDGPGPSGQTLPNLAGRSSAHRGLYGALAGRNDGTPMAKSHLTYWNLRLTVSFASGLLSVPDEGCCSIE